jgi:hypothetical protein
MFSCGGGGKDAKSSGNTQEGKINDLSKERLNGKVKTIRQRVYWAQEKFGRIEKGKLQKVRAQDYLKEYDKSGFLTEETYFDLRDSVISSHKITYGDEPGQITKEEFYDANKPTSTVTYTYEGDELKQKEITDVAGKQKERYAYTYYDNGLLMDEDKYNAANQLVQKIVFQYNASKLPTEKQYYWGGGAPYRKEELKYDTNNNLCAVVTYKYVEKEPVFDGSVSYLQYNGTGNYQEKEIYNNEEIKTEINEYTYDQYGNLTEYSISKFIVNKINEVLEVVENAETAGNEATDGETETVVETVVETVETAVETDSPGEWAQGTGALYEYVYDENNNWTREITYKTEPIAKPVRQFYYERIFVYY